MKQFYTEIYVYCTDFVISLANITGLSYYEINFLFFCVLYPFAFFSLLFLYLIQTRRLKKYVSK